MASQCIFCIWTHLAFRLATFASFQKQKDQLMAHRKRISHLGTETVLVSLWRDGKELLPCLNEKCPPGWSRQILPPWIGLSSGGASGWICLWQHDVATCYEDDVDWSSHPTAVMCLFSALVFSFNRWHLALCACTPFDLFTFLKAKVLKCRY